MWPSEFRFFQLAFVVDDLFASARRWAEVFGVGPFHVMKRNVQSAVHRGLPTGLDVHLAVAQAGPVQIELIEQKCDSPSHYRDVYPHGSGGVHHLGTVVKDYEGAKAHYERMGCPVTAELTGSAMRVAYFDFRAEFGLMIEVIEDQPEFMAALKRISDNCANWDGTDPLRILTRDGYRVAVPEAVA